MNSIPFVSNEFSSTASSTSSNASTTPSTENKLMIKKSRRINLRTCHHKKNKIRAQTHQNKLQYHILQIDSIRKVYESKINNY